MSSLKSKLTASVKQAKASSNEGQLGPQVKPEKSEQKPAPRKKSLVSNSSVSANVVASHQELFPSRIWPD